MLSEGLTPGVPHLRSADSSHCVVLLLVSLSSRIPRSDGYEDRAHAR